MKSIVRNIVFDSISIYIITQFFSGVMITGGIQFYILCGLLITICMTIIKPIINVVTFPLTILTFGLYGLIGGFVSNAIIFYLLTVFYKPFIIHSFSTPAFRYNGMHVSSIFLSGIFPFIAVGFSYFLLKGVFTWLTQE